MDQGLIPRRYAKALYEVALARGKEDALYTQMQDIDKAFASEPRLQATMNNPFVSDSDKANLLFTAANAKKDDAMMADFVKLLSTNKRLGMARDIATAYIRIYRQAHDIHKVEVVAAAQMPDEEQERLKKLILSHLNGGTMEYSFRVDPELIGGFAVTIDNERLDASVKNELKQLRLKLLSNK